MGVSLAQLARNGGTSASTKLGAGRGAETSFRLLPVVKPCQTLPLQPHTRRLVLHHSNRQVPPGPRQTMADWSGVWRPTPERPS